MTLLALDASTARIGHAVLNANDALLDYGAFTPSGPLFDRITQGVYWLQCWLDVHGVPPTVAIERPFVGQSWDSTIKQSYMVGALIAVARGRGCRVIEVNPQERLSVAGIKPGKNVKRDVVGWVNLMYDLYLKTAEHDIADAILVGRAALCKVRMEAME